MKKALRAAVERRRALALPTPLDVVRLIDGESDGLPGLVVDRYGSVLRLEVFAAAWPSWIDEAASELGKLVGARAAVGLLRSAGGRSEHRVLLGDVPAAHVVEESGLRFLVRLDDKDAAGVGVFVDHRCGRARVRAFCAERPGCVVMNLFAHAGAFGVAAAVGGAGRVDHVDAARKCAPWAALNLALNGIDPRKHRFLVDDALKILDREAARGGGYDLVICDPPTAAVRPDGTRFLVARDLPLLAARGISALAPRGALLLSTNDREIPVARVTEIVRDVARAAGRALASLDEVELPADVPSGTSRDPKGRSMRGVFATCA